MNAETTQNVILYTDMILEYWVDGVHYFGGDFFGFRKCPSVLRLTPGSHQIDVRLVRDVRAMGGVLEPTIDVLLELQQTSGSLETARPGILMADVVDGNLASSVGSVYVRNSGNADLEVISAESSDVRLTPVLLLFISPMMQHQRYHMLITYRSKSLYSRMMGILLSSQVKPDLLL